VDNAPPRLVAGRYRLRVRLGSGGMGTVWRAVDEVLGREVAVKEITFPQGLSDADRDVLRERTRREARAAARLDHPSAVTVYDVVEDGGAPYLIMELVEARTLADVVREDGPLPPAEAARIGLSLLGALDAAHRSGIVHRDVKPSNVLVRADGRVVLTDFGIATSTGDPSITHTGLLLGSPAYLSPERVRGQAPGPPADLWSLGATLFTAVEGRPPYEQDDALATVMAVVTGEHAPYALAGPLVPVLDGLLVKDPAQRLDAAATERMLREVAERGPVQRTQVLAVPPAAAAPPAASRTAALDVGDVRSELAAAAPPVRPARPRPAPAPPPARRARGALVAAAAVLLVGAGTALALTVSDDPGGTATGTGSTPSAVPSTAAPSPETPAPETEAPQTQAPEQEAPETEAPQTEEPQTEEPEAEEPQTEAPEQELPSTGGGAAAVPAGWSTDQGGAGWTVALPPGYTQTRAGEYRDPDTGRTLRVETGPGQPDAVADRERAARSFAQRHPTYEQIRIEPVDYRGYEAADWEFTYEGLHVLNRVFVVDGTGHSLFFQFPEGDAAAAEDFAGIVRGFHPAT
jgi:hypothetical protein